MTRAWAGGPHPARPSRRRHQHAAPRGRAAPPAAMTTRRSRSSAPRVPPLDALCAVADDLRAEAVGDDVTYVDQPQHQLHERLLRGLPLLRVRPARARRGVLHAHAGRGRRPRRGSVGLGRHRGVHAGRHPPRSPRLLLFRSPRRREGARAGDARPRVQPDGDPERLDEARHLLRGVPHRGEGATASARSPAPRRRSSTTRSGGCSRRASFRPTPGSRSSAPRTAWASAPARPSCSATSTRRRTGSRTSAGSRGSRRIRAASRSSCRCRSCTRTRRSTWRARRAPVPRSRTTSGCTRVARILLDGLIPNIQVSWVKLGVAACQSILRAGANDFGGTLMEETISRMAGAEWGILDDARAVRRRDPRDRARPRGAHDDVRPRRTPSDGGLSVNRLDLSRQCD